MTVVDVLGVTFLFFFFSSRRRHTRFKCDWSSDVCSSDLFRRSASSAEDNKADEADRRKPSLRMGSKSPGHNESKTIGGLETKLRSGGRALCFGAKAAWHGAG